MVDNAQLYDKILACWIGKNIGGTIGSPVEGRMEILHFTGLPDVSDGPLPNDDLDLQLVNLHALEQRGVRVTTRELSEEWAEHVRFPFDEYGYALANMRRGLAAPLSGFYNNPFTNCMGSPIRSELWAVLFPGDPERAVRYAAQDAAVDHAGGEGMYGEMLFAALESMAFEETDPVSLIRRALAFVPRDSRVGSAVRDTLSWFESGVSYEYVREMILSGYGNRNFTDAPQNIAFTLVGLLYGADFIDGMLKTVNLGYDTDCTCATFGSIYGILHGTAGIPENWRSRVGEDIKISREIDGIAYPHTLTDLTERTLSVKRRMDADTTPVPAAYAAPDFAAQVFCLPGGCTDLTVRVTGADGPLVVPGQPKTVQVQLHNGSLETQTLAVALEGMPLPPVAVSLEPGGETTVQLTACGEPGQYGTAAFTLTLRRLFRGFLWRENRIPFVLPAASRWMLDGKERYFADGYVPFSAGEHTAETTLDIPDDRTVKLICASPERLTVSLDGEVVIECREGCGYMPAFHRCPESQYAVLPLKAGRHTVQVTVSSQADSQLMLLPVSVGCEAGGIFYGYFVDCAIGASDGCPAK